MSFLRERPPKSPDLAELLVTLTNQRFRIDTRKFANAIDNPSLDAIGGWPDPGPATYPGPVLWLTGEDSAYVQPEHEPDMAHLFPAVERVVVPRAGHWVHADNPDATVAALLELEARTHR